MQLSDIKVGSEGVIKDYSCGGAKRQRLIDLGFVRGVKILVKQVAPLGDPIIVKINDSEFAIRKSDAKFITIA